MKLRAESYMLVKHCWNLRFLSLLTCLMLTALTSLAASNPASAQSSPSSATVTVNAGQALQVVDKRMLGVNTATWDWYVDGADTKSLLSAAGARALRFPGGSESDGYDWTSQSYGGEPMAPQYADLANTLKADAYITTNYGSGSPQMAAAWVAYNNARQTSSVVIGTDSPGRNWQTAAYWAALRAASPISPDDGLNFLRVSHSSPFGLKYYEIGNECYGGWENDTHTKQHDPVLYAKFFKAAIELMKRVDGSIKVGAVSTASEDDYGEGETVVNPVTGQSHSGWTAVLYSTLASIKSKPDYVIFHNYIQAPGSENDQYLLHASTSWTGYANSIRTMLNDYFGSSIGPKVEIDCTENNSVYTNPGKQSTSLVNGLFWADSVGQLLQTEFKSLLWWDLRNGADPNENNSSSLYGWREYGDYGIVSAGASLPGAALDTPYPTYFALKLMSHFAGTGDSVVAASSNSPQLGAYACVATNGSLNLLLINKNPASEIDAQIDLTGFTPASSASVFRYGETEDTAQSKGNPVNLTRSILSVSGSPVLIDLPPYSMTVVSMPAE